MLLPTLHAQVLQANLELIRQGLVLFLRLETSVASLATTVLWSSSQVASRTIR